MSAEQRRRADTRLDEALERAGLQDPRADYRERLRLLRDRDQDAFSEARRYYEEILVPRVAAPDSDPVLEWFEYGRKLVELEGDGRAANIFMVDPSGRSAPFNDPLPMDHLVLYLPEDTRPPVLPLNVPLELSPAQQASYDLLVLQARK
jgi:hypothetical protein